MIKNLSFSLIHSLSFNRSQKTFTFSMILYLSRKVIFMIFLLLIIEKKIRLEVRFGINKTWIIKIFYYKFTLIKKFQASKIINRKLFTISSLVFC